jgi:hypothetical protein
MQINLASATPWPEINGTLKNARSIKVVADGKTFDGDADLSIDDFGNVTLQVGKASKKAKK